MREELDKSADEEESDATWLQVNVGFVSKQCMHAQFCLPLSLYVSSMRVLYLPSFVSPFYLSHYHILAPTLSLFSVG